MGVPDGARLWKEKKWGGGSLLVNMVRGWEYFGGGRRGRGREEGRGEGGWEGVILSRASAHPSARRKAG